MRTILLVIFAVAVACAQYVPPGGGGSSGTAGGDLSGTYPNPTVTATHITPVPCPAGSAPTGVDGALVSVGCAALPTGTSGYMPNGLISGGGVVWNGNLAFVVSAAAYVINNTQYSSAQTNITLAAADPTNDRIDVIYADTSGTVAALTGTPAVNPSQPTVDPGTQLALTFIYVPASSTTPANIASSLLYDEDAGWTAEWNVTTSGSGWAAASTNNPYHGTKDIEATSVGTSAYVQLARGSGTTDPTTQNVLVFYIRSKGTWGSKRSLAITLANSGTLVGTALTFVEGSFGFNSSNTTSYQQILIPLSVFQPAAKLFNQIRFTISGSGTNLGFYLDYVQFQSGAAQQNTGTPMNWRGAWSSSAAYNPLDVVTYSGSIWVAASANANSAPATNNSNWAIGGSTASTTVNGVSCALGSTCTVSLSGCTVDGSNNVTCSGTLTVGSGGTSSGAVSMTGKTSGSVASIVASDSTAAGTITHPGATGTMAYVPSAIPVGNCPQAGSDGIGLVDSGHPCGSGSVVGPSASVYRSSTLSVSSNTDTMIPFDSEQWDTGSIHSTSSNTSRMTAPTTGFYLATCSASTTTNVQGYLSIRVNGSLVNGFSGQQMVNTTFGSSITTVSQIVSLTAGQYVECDAFINGGATLAANQAGAQLTKLSATF